MSNDLGLLMQVTELTADDKAVLWNNYQKAMVSSVMRAYVYYMLCKHPCLFSTCMMKDSQLVGLLRPVYVQAQPPAHQLADGAGRLV